MFFFGHGNPMHAIGDSAFTREWSAIGGRIDRPDAIVVVSAHWETDGSFVTSNPRQRTIHDFYGFPAELFEVVYDAPGDPELAREIVATAGNDKIGADDGWGLDHGTWTVLRHIFPLADVPVIQISLDRRKSATEHFEFARGLRFLREKRILFIGSGNIVHNLRRADFRRPDGEDWAVRADSLIRDLVLARDHSALSNLDGLGADARLAVPTPEHFLPLLYVLALSDEADDVRVFNEAVELGSISMTSFEFSR